ncbi:MAG: acyl-ACP--UDP-N-acetylglucosamine O-acyltransferase [Candidatus Omnitrophica bacterium]|nr:acyl-ACP--UDP-N-acetylglucosamine O-acyltransferase [Candidatus Omnitrophota bacterium]
MAVNIHKTAIVDKRAKLADGVSVGPFSIIGGDVVIGEGTTIGPFSIIEGWTTIGRENKIFSHVVIGTISQDKKYKGEKSFVEIGDRNTIREFTTINLGTSEKEGYGTRVGSDNFMMAYSHIAHDCLVGNSNVIANMGTLAGHVTLEDGVVLGGLAGIHQFVRIGRLAVIGGISKVVKDVPPYMMVDGQRASACGLNLVGLRRAGISKKAHSSLKQAFKILFKSELSLPNALEKVKTEVPPCDEITHLIEFINGSERGICG